MDLVNIAGPSRRRAAVAALGAVLLLPHRTEAVQDRSCAPVVVTVDWDRNRAETVSGVVVRVRYPASLDVPASGKPDSSKDRVELLGGTSGGLFDAVPRDGDGDGRKDVLSIGLITAGIRPGQFARVLFDCVAGATPPRVSELGCVSDVADDAGAVPSLCSVAMSAE